MTTDAIKHLGAEFHRAADSLADTLARLDNARLERLQFLRRCSKDGTALLAVLKEEIRTLPVGGYPVCRGQKNAVHVKYPLTHCAWLGKVLLLLPNVVCSPDLKADRESLAAALTTQSL